MNHALRALAAGPLVWTLACVTTHGAWPAPPTDPQLANDGTSAAQSTLEKRHALRTSHNPFPLVVGKDTIEAGDARRPTTDGWLDLDAQDEVAAYIGAGGIDVQGGYRAWRFVGLGTAIAMAVMGVAWLAGVVALNLFAAGGLPGFDVASGAVVAGTVSSATFGVLVFCEALAGVVLVVAQAMVRQTLRQQADRYNTRLRERIRANVMTVVAAPPPAPPAGTTKPVQVEEPAPIAPEAPEPQTP